MLLRHANSLSQAERELIATYVSSQNNCHYCQSIHGAIAAAHLEGNEELVQSVKHDFHSAEITPKLKALLVIAGKVQQDGKKVTEADVQAARDQHATDLEIHDTVLIAAAFCMYNRYVDGLATWQPREPAAYDEMGKHLAAHGYQQSSVPANTPAKLEAEPVASSR